MKHGRATIEAYSGAPVADDEIVAQWVSLIPGWAPQMYRQVPVNQTSLVFLESHLDAAGYEDLLNGRYDHALTRLRFATPTGTIWRWDHEMNGKPNAWRTWGRMDPRRYIAGWRRVAGILGPMFWCPTSDSSNWRDYWPGEKHVSHVGFDWYDRGKREALPTALARRMRRLRELSSRRILLGELGSAALPDICGRPEWLASADQVPELWGACYFDVDRTSAEGKGTDWRMNEAMDAIW